MIPPSVVLPCIPINQTSSVRFSHEQNPYITYLPADKLPSGDLRHSQAVLQPLYLPKQQPEAREKKSEKKKQARLTGEARRKQAHAHAC